MNEPVFDSSHYAATAWQKLKRAAQLGPRYYFWDLPRYLRHRRGLGLSLWDWQAFCAPLREIRPQLDASWQYPERYREALDLLATAKVRLTLPPHRVAGLVAAWRETRPVPGDIIECGAFRGATSLLLATLGRLHDSAQRVWILDTFCGVEQTARFDVSRTGRDYVPSEHQVAVIERQAEMLGVEQRIDVHPGLFCDTFAKLAALPLRFSFAHIDANLYDGTRQACEFVLPRMAPGGIVVFDDYYGVCDLGARLAIDAALAPRNLRPSPLAGYSAFLRIE